MALKIRLRQLGRTNRLAYRLVVTDTRSPRDGKYLEMLGWYDPHLEKDFTVHEERVGFWLEQGAELTPKARALVARSAPTIMKTLREREEKKRLKERSKKKERKKKKK